VFDIYTIIFLALAVFIFLRLRSVLGQRTGRERPPYDPYSSAPGAIRPAAPGDKVVALPGRAPDTAQKTAEPAEPVDRWKGIAEPGSALATGLDAIAREDKSFDARSFLTGARAAYDMIVTAYAAGDRKQLKNLLGKEVYDGFESAIREREQKGETVECPKCGRHLRIRLEGWAKELKKLSWVVVDGRPADGCKGCAGPVERVRRGRPRKYCESCHPTRRGGNKRSQKAA